MILQKYLSCFLLVGSCAFAFPITAWSQSKSRPVAGMVHAYFGKASDYALTRAGRELRIGLLLPLEEGDEILLRTREGNVTIKYTDGTTELVTGTQSPFLVSLHGAPVSLSDKVLSLLERAGLWMTEQHENADSPSGTRGQNDPFEWSIAGLAEGDASVAQGERVLGLSWYGGKSPYRVRLQALDGTMLIDSKVDDAEVLANLPHKLTLGRYDASVEDAGGRRITGSFLAVELTEVPVSDLELPAWLAPAMAKVIRARELAQTNNNTWCYEAYLSLVGTEHELPLAKHLRYLVCE